VVIAEPLKNLLDEDRVGGGGFEIEDGYESNLRRCRRRVME
jgi:hypothetical protein